MTKSISRRDFLKGTAAGALSVAATSILGGLSVKAQEAVYIPGEYSASEKGAMRTGWERPL